MIVSWSGGVATDHSQSLGTPRSQDLDLQLVSRLHWNLRPPRSALQREVNHRHHQSRVDCLSFNGRRFCCHVWHLCIKRCTGFVEHGFFPRMVFSIECLFEQCFLFRCNVPTHLLSHTGLFADIPVQPLSRVRDRKRTHCSFLCQPQWLDHTTDG